jgi:hypothetical protein
MADANTDVSDNVATRVIIIVLVAAFTLTIISIAIVYLISHNSYAASYYTISALFDANNEGSTAFISAVLASNPSSYAYYSFIAVSIVDGIAKAIIIGFLIAAFINLLSNIDLKSKIEIMTAKYMKGHVIICGYSMLAERLCNDFKKNKIRFVIIEKDPEKVNLLRDLDFNVVEGDFTERKVLDYASIENAKNIIFATESDFVNLLGIVTAHHMRPSLKIIARARNETSVRKMQRGGATLCVVPEVVAGIELGDRITKM